MQNSNQIARLSAKARHILADGSTPIALFLDVDGTLLEIAPTPTGVAVPDGLTDLLAHIANGLDGALAILTGRQLTEIDALLTPLKLVGAGVHGAELRTQPGGPINSTAAVIPQQLIDEVVKAARMRPGVLVEPKGPGLAIHYRNAPDLKPVLAAELADCLNRHRDGNGNDLVLCEGRKLFEIVPNGLSKGTALTTIAELPQFRGRMPIMIGDDVGDEPAIAAAERLGGTGLKVLGEHFRDRAFDLDGPKSVLAWLQRLDEQLQSG